MEGLTVSYRFNPPPGWPVPPEGWAPPADWQPDASWPAPPADWQFWVEESAAAPSYDPAAAAPSYDPAAAAPSYDPTAAAPPYDPAAAAPSYDPAAAAPSYDPAAGSYVTPDPANQGFAGAPAYPTSSYAAAPAPFSSDPVMQPFQSDPASFTPGGYAPGVPGGPSGPGAPKKSRGGLIALIAGGLVVVALVVIGIVVLTGGDNDEADPSPTPTETTDDPTDDPTTRDPDPTDDPTDDPTTADPTGGTSGGGALGVPMGNGNVPVDMPGYTTFDAATWQTFESDPASLVGQKFVIFAYIWYVDSDPLELQAYAGPEMLTRQYDSDFEIVVQGDASVIGGVSSDKLVQMGVEVVGVSTDSFSSGAPMVKAEVLTEVGTADLAGDLNLGEIVDEGYGMWSLPITFINTGLFESDFSFEFSIESADGATQYETSYAYFTSVRPGQTATEEMNFFEEIPDDAVFRVISARRS